MTCARGEGGRCCDLVPGGGVVTCAQGGEGGRCCHLVPGGGREVLSRDLWCCTPPPIEQNE